MGEGSGKPALREDEEGVVRLLGATTQVCPPCVLCL